LAPAEEAETAEDLRHQKSSPVVRRIAAEHGIDISMIEGSGAAGRVTKQDILDYIESRTAAAPADAAGASAPAAPVAHAAGDEVVPMTVMRRRIAGHMIASRRASAHVHSVFEVDFSKVAKLREAKKAEYEASGAKLTYLPFVVQAVVTGLRAFPVLNASIDGDSIVYHKDINIGIAVALDWGLIVPVVKQADEKSLLGLARAMQDLAGRARSKQLRPDEVQGGTFTITNPGVYGALFGMPIISQPQVAILDVGAIEKRAVVIDDAIAIRSMAYLSLGFDHRLIDGSVADQFLSVVKKQIETFDPSGL
jgi:2-oxoglutarate dehydrogenase E2 component (dihydrolipoamide succinyltransferase)